MKYQIIQGNCLETLKTIEQGSVDCCVTSPPYWGLRDYGESAQLGLEATPEEYVQNMVQVFSEVKRVLSKEGTLWLNLGDSYAGNCSRTSSGRAGMGNKREGIYTKSGNGLKAKDLVGIPWKVAFALQADGWYLRQDIIWHKPNPMPESVTDRCTKAHEYIFLMSKSQKYYYDHESIKEPQKSQPEYGTANKRSVWAVPINPYKEAHFATYPQKLIRPCIKAGSRVGGTILDPFGGSGTTAEVANELGRKAILCELNPKYIEIANKRLSKTQYDIFPQS
jgi:DNA modification methylase